ncbi:MAG: hypothetical protein IT177_01595 [Acidobacteria bacterium]|nr:hypothetical protein [Acidobacteriota bacterium]
MATTDMGFTVEGGEGLRLEAQLVKSQLGDEVPGAVAAAEHAADLLDERKRKFDDAVRSGQYTPAGLQAVVRAASEKVLIAAAEAERLATRIEAQIGQSIDNELARLSTPARDAVEALRHQQLAQLLAGIDPIYRQQVLVAAARRGEGMEAELLRAALSFPQPPFDTPGWPVLVTPETRAAIREAVEARVSPSGPAPFEARAYRSIAAHLRRAVGVAA